MLMKEFDLIVRVFLIVEGCMVAYKCLYSLHLIFEGKLCHISLFLYWALAIWSPILTCYRILLFVFFIITYTVFKCIFCDIHLTWLGTCTSRHCAMVFFGILVFPVCFCACLYAILIFFLHMFFWGVISDYNTMLTFVSLFWHFYLLCLFVLFTHRCQYNGILCNCNTSERFI